jgi:hypothetical protein
MLTAIIMHCYTGVKSLSVMLLVTLIWVCNFVVGPKASHLPNTDNTPVPCRIMLLRSRLLRIMVTLSLCDAANIHLL